MQLATPSGKGLVERASYRWLILLVCTFSQTSIVMPNQGIPTLAYFLQSAMSLSRAQVGMFSTAISGGAIGVLLISGWLADLVGVRRLLLVGQVLIGLCVIAMGLSDSFTTALLVLVPAGLGAALVGPAITKAVMYWFTARQRATAMSVKQTGVPLAGAIAAAVLPSLALAYDWRMAVIVLGIGVMAMGMIAFLLYRESPEPAGAAAQRRLSLQDVRRVLTNRGVVIGSIATVPLVILQYALVTYFLLYLKEVMLFPVVLAGLLLSVMQISGIAGRIFWGIVSDLVFGSRIKTMEVLIALGTLCTVAIALLPADSSPWLVGILSFLLGFTGLSWHGVFFAEVGELAGKESSGTAAGFSLTLGYLGILIGPPLFGAVVDHSGSYRLAWLLTAALCAGAVPLLLTLRGKRGRPDRAS